MLPKLQSKQMNFSQSFGLGEESFRPFSMFVWQCGGKFFKEDLTASAWDEPEAVRGFTELVELYTKYKIPKEDIAIESFRRGEIPIMLLAWWNYGSFQQSLPELKGKWGVELVPGHVRNGKLDQANWFGGTPLMIFKTSRHQKEAWEFIKWFFQDDIQAEFGSRIMKRIPAAFFFSANMEVAKKIDYFPKEHIKTMYEQSYQSMAPRYGLGSVVGYRFVRDAAMSVLLQNTKPEEALTKAYKQVDAEMKRKVGEFERFIKRIKK